MLAIRLALFLHFDTHTHTPLGALFVLYIIFMTVYLSICHISHLFLGVLYWAALALRDTVIWELAINIVELTNKQ